MKTLLLFSDDDQLRLLLAELDDCRLIEPDDSAWQDQTVDVCLLDISTWPMLDTPTIEQVVASAHVLLVVADVEDQDQFVQYSAAHNYMLKPLTLARLRKHFETLNQTREQLAQYLRVVRHDLKNPLSSISGYADLLLSVQEDAAVRATIGDLTPQQTKFLVSIHRAAEKMGDMIDALGDGE